MVTLISAAPAAFCTSQGAFAHLWTTPLCWRAHDVAIAMSEMSAPNIKKILIWPSKPYER